MNQKTKIAVDARFKLIEAQMLLLMKNATKLGIDKDTAKYKQIADIICGPIGVEVQVEPK